MTKILKILMTVGIIVTLSSCKEIVNVYEEYEDGDFTLELIGEANLEIPRGEEYVDPGVLLDGETSIAVSCRMNVNTNRLGTYYVEFEFMGKKLTRTVTVVNGVLDNYLEAVSNLENLSSYTCESTIEGWFIKNNVEKHVYDRGEYQVNGDYSIREYERNSVGSAYIENYIMYKNEVRDMNEMYYFDENGYWYSDREILHLELTLKTSLITEFDLTDVNTVTKVEEDGKEIYTAYVNYNGFFRAFTNASYRIIETYFNTNATEILQVEVTVEDGNITRIETDLQALIADTIEKENSVTTSEYKYVYVFSNHNTTPEIVIPAAGVEARKLVFKDMEGTGTQIDPYLISDIYDFLQIENDLSAHYKMMTDIDLEEYAWSPFGVVGEGYICFTGTLDGNGHRIDNMNISGVGSFHEYGLFKCVGDGFSGTIQNLSITNVDITVTTQEYFRFGVVAGEVNGGTISNVHVTGDVHINVYESESNTFAQIGTIAGRTRNVSLITDCTSGVILQVSTNVEDDFLDIGEITGIGEEFLSNTTFHGNVAIVREIT